uniref:HEAT repeat-containing protein 1 n=1 Tax=Canis lupus dingo TaxID=286419 RepID=A0A8C0LR43_CANLU
MTSLAQQLQRLALPQSDRSLLSRDEVASLLFDPKEAATVDRDTAFAIGCTGLEELLGIDPSFEQFEAPLFSQLAKTLERSVQTKAVNKQLDENISLFLIHLSPYFLLKPAQKCLEWLIHRFHIHLYNQDSLIACVLPYHETRIFVRVIQLLKINNPKHKWFWLSPQHGVPLARGTLITHCYKDLGFMDFICSLVTKSVKIFTEYPGSSAQLRVLLTFYASTIVSAIVTAEDKLDNIVAKLFPYIQKGLKSSLPDYRAATYMIICQISVKVTMEDTFVNSLASQIIKTLTKIPSLIKDGLGCLIVLMQRQKPESLGKKPFSHLCNVPDLITILHGISEKHDISPLLRYMLPHLVVSIINHLSCLLILVLFCSLLFEEYISYSSQEEIHPDKVSLLNEQFLPLIRLLESKYPRTLDIVLEDRLKEITDLKKQELFHQFISLSTSGGKYQVNFSSEELLQLWVCGLYGYLKSSGRKFPTSSLNQLCLCLRYEVLEVAADILIKEEILSENDQLSNQVVVHLLPFMIIVSDDMESAEMKIAIYLSKSGILKSSHQCVYISLCFVSLFLRVHVDDIWWNPEQLEEDSRAYLRLLIGLFEMILSGADAIHFRVMMKLFIKVLEDVFQLFKFFSVLWTYGSSLSNPLNCSVKTALQTQALYIGCAMLSAQKVQNKHQLASLSSPVVTSLLINLGSPVKEVRRASILCLQALSGVVSRFHLVIDHLVPKTEEITSDATYAAQVNSSAKKIDYMHMSLSETLKNLLNCVYSCPSYIAKDLVKVLEEVNNEMVLSQLLPMVEQLLEKIQKEPTAVLKDEAIILHLILGKYNEYSASLLHKDPKSLDIFIQAVYTTKELYTGMPTIQITALEKITKPFFAAISDEKVQQKLLRMLFDLLVNCKNSHCAQTISSVFKGISVNAEQVRIELEPPDKTKSLGTIQQTRRQKMQKLQDLESVQEVGGSYWQRVTLILELLQHKKKLKNPQILIPTLFNLLSRSLEPLPPEQGNMEYTKQLILSCLLNICQKLSPDGGKISKDVLDEEKFNVELIVQCIRVSEMPQTHHHALLLLGTVAGIFPDKVLHNIMSIFTFMGANVMRLDDTYSFQVINKTVKMVIPALIQSDGGDFVEVTRNVEGVVVKIINVFVDALPHVPEHRRLPILVQLVDTLGAERFLWILLVLLFEQYVTKTVLVAAYGEKDAILEADTEFWISVCCEFSVQHQIQSLMNILQYLIKLPEEKEEAVPKAVSTKSESQEQMLQIFNIDTHTNKQLRHLKFLSVSFMSQLLASTRFIRKVIAQNSHVDLLCFRLLETVLGYINTVAQSVEKNADKLTVKFWRALLSKAYDMLDKVNALLPTETFIAVIKGLLGNPLPSVRRKALDLLNNKLQQNTSWKKKIVYRFLKLVPVLLAIVQHKKMVEEQAINRQTALYTLKLLCKNFGAENPGHFVPVLNAAVKLIAPETKEEKNVLGSALLCVAEVASTLEALAIPQLPSLMPSLLTRMKNTSELLSGEVYLLSALAALHKVVETLPHFISPYLEGVLSQVSTVTSAEMGSASQANVRVTSLKKTLATTLSPRVLLPAINKTYKQIEKNWKNHMGPFMSILQEHIGIMKKEELTSHQSQLTIFFLEALDFRAQHSESDLEEIGKTENFIIDCLVAMVVKLSEVTFRPLFFKLFDWAKTEDAPKDRLLTFYNLADCIAEKLKGLFTLFAGHLVKPFADTLNQVNISKTDEAFFDSDNDPEKCCLLLQFILNCLYKIFLFDTQHFISKERAEALMMPLVDQLENRLGGDAHFQERVTKHLIPCIAQFSVAVADDSLWKPLNYQILLKTRDSSPKVRFAALITVLALAEKLKENYIVLLPESIPFLAELMEDECEEVEHQCQKTIQQLEAILGEPLQSYF